MRNDRPDPTLVGDVVLTAKSLCEQLDYMLVIDFIGSRAYARDTTVQYQLCAGGDNFVEALIALIYKLKISLDILQKRKLPE